MFFEDFLHQFPMAMMAVDGDFGRGYDMKSLVEIGDDDCCILAEFNGDMYEIIAHRNYRMFRGKLRPYVTYSEPVKLNICNGVIDELEAFNLALERI